MVEPCGARRVASIRKRYVHVQPQHSLVISSLHHYADAQRRHHPVSLFVTESTAAFNRPLVRALRALDAQSRDPTSTDHTPYGTARSSIRRIYAYHSAAIATDIVSADALSVHDHVAHASHLLSIGHIRVP